MKKIIRLLLGLLLGTVCGAGVFAGIIFALPEEYNLHSTTTEPFVNFLQFVTHNLNLHPERFVIICGAVIGAITGILSANVIPYQRKWLSVFLALIVGIIGGGGLLYSSSEKWVDDTMNTWEHTAEEQRAFTYFICLRAVDHGMTNQTYLVNFQKNGRSVLKDYIHDAENWKPNMLVWWPETNSGAYKAAKRYLATHPEN
jgi:hypothetical protein